MAGASAPSFSFFNASEEAEAERASRNGPDRDEARVGLERQSSTAPRAPAPDGADAARERDTARSAKSAFISRVSQNAPPRQAQLLRLRIMSLPVAMGNDERRPDT